MMSISMPLSLDPGLGSMAAAIEAGQERDRNAAIEERAIELIRSMTVEDRAKMIAAISDEWSGEFGDKPGDIASIVADIAKACINGEYSLFHMMRLVSWVKEAAVAVATREIGDA